MNQSNLELPDCVIEIFKKDFEVIPSETFIGSIKKDGIDLIVKKNEILWYKKVIHQNQEILNEGVVGYGAHRMYIYFKRDEGGSSYRLTILTVGSKDDITLKMLINGLKPYLYII